MPNRLQHETSPYLLQHADNPVNWYPWSDEAFEAAKEQDKPILLSIGYSACHWCHVMEHESFEDAATAAFLNENFVSIKVDREERPDVDDIYMQATLLFNRGGGGWPMTVFVTPDGHPFHAGTYYPKEPRYGMPSFRQVMEAVIETYRTKRGQVEQTARSVSADLNRSMFESLAAEPGTLTPALLDTAAQNMLSQADPVHGGLTRGKPKFPNPVNLDYLLRYHAATQNDRALQVALLALRKMAQGGIYDQLGGGFHRYSVDEKWLVPHFEKMLYDNALLARVYLHGWQVSGDPFLREIVEGTLDYILREMTSPDGGFTSSQDADSEGEEGKFFVWTEAELRQALDGVVSNVKAVLDYWGVTAPGNFEGKNILHAADMMERVAVRAGLPIEQMRDEVAAARTVLFALRKNRVPPGRDDKILAAWNGMMLAAFAEAARVLGQDDYRRAAVENA
ncbi:MAG: thioredoxin domain-containing protein, partial [Chloroflexi bacterium]